MKDYVVIRLLDPSSDECETCCNLKDESNPNHNGHANADDAKAHAVALGWTTGQLFERESAN